MECLGYRKSTANIPVMTTSWDTDGFILLISYALA